MSSGGDDWCDDEDEREGSQPSKELDLEWEARKSSFWNSGYRDGLDQGKERMLQDGFDEGFQRGIGAGIEWGGATGAARTLQLLESHIPGLSCGVLKDAKEEGMKLPDVPEATAGRELCRPILQELSSAGAPDHMLAREAEEASSLITATAAVLAALAAEGCALPKSFLHPNGEAFTAADQQS